MEKHKLTSFRFSRRPGYYLKHPWMLIRETYLNFRDFVHRGRYGFAATDVWEWYTWWTSVGADSLRYLAEHACGFPGDETYDSPEKWTKHLRELADQLDWCASSCEISSHPENKFKLVYDEIRKNQLAYNTVMSPKGNKYVTRPVKELSPEEEIIVKKYYAREEELFVEDADKRAAIFGELGRNLGRYWD